MAALPQFDPRRLYDFIRGAFTSCGQSSTRWHLLSCSSWHRTRARRRTSTATSPARSCSRPAACMPQERARPRQGTAQLHALVLPAAALHLERRLRADADRLSAVGRHAARQVAAQHPQVAAGELRGQQVAAQAWRRACRSARSVRTPWCVRRRRFRGGDCCDRLDARATSY